MGPKRSFNLGNMDEEYDVIVLGTGLKECILSGLLSVSGKRVPHMDRNNYYGGTSASLNLKQLHEKFGAGEPPATLGSSRDYNVDLIPKFIMANGILTKLLVHTKVTRYMNYKVIDGSFVYLGGSKGFFSDTAGQIHKVPSNASEAVSSTFMGMFEKNRARQFFTFCQNYDLNDQKTWQKFDVKRQSMQDLYTKFGLEDKTQDFIGHSMALWRDETYRTKRAFDTMERMKLYADSMARFGKSPYIYPLYGLGELPQGFARLSAIYGGVYMLNKPFLGLEMGADGKVCGVKSTTDEGEGEACAKAPIVVGSPDYFPERTEEKGSVVRAICIMKGQAPGTEAAASCQIIVPGSQCSRDNDVYVTVLESSHQVAPSGRFIGIVSTTVETGNPIKELQAGLSLLGQESGNILECFPSVSSYMVPTAQGSEGVFVTQSYDASSHFETACLDVLSVFEQCTGKRMDLDKLPIQSAEDE